MNRTEWGWITTLPSSVETELVSNTMNFTLLLNWTEINTELISDSIVLVRAELNYIAILNDILYIFFYLLSTFWAQTWKWNS